jgi:hypothetical protein
VFLLCRPEYLSLHSRPHKPEGVGDDVADEAAETGGERIELEGVVLPAIVGLQIKLSVLIKREVDRVEEGNAEYRDRVTYREQVKFEWAGLLLNIK